MLQSTLTSTEEEAMNQAQATAADRFSEAGISFTDAIREQVYWSLLGELRRGGVPAMMHYANTAKLPKRRRLVLIGYKEIETEI